MSDSLDILRKELSANPEGQLIFLTSPDSEPTTDFKLATHLKLSSDILTLDTPTKFIVNGKQTSLRLVVYCWIHRELSSSDFIQRAEDDNIDEFLTFGQRNDLSQWLSGSTDESDYISTTLLSSTGNNATATTKSGGSEKVSISKYIDMNDPFLKSVLSNERELVDHNASLRGSKPIDFTNTAKECEIRIIKPSKRKSTTPIAAIAKPDIKKVKKTMTPVILISPASSALLSLVNISAFLERSKFINPNDSNLSTEDRAILSETSTDANIRSISHSFPKAGKVRIHITNSVDSFTKSEYWDRVIAVFTTGQEWQFKSYKWTNPAELFRNVKGYYFHFDQDKIPESIKSWNLETMSISKNRRFKDAETLGLFWDSLEKVLLNKGYKA